MIASCNMVSYNSSSSTYNINKDIIGKNQNGATLLNFNTKTLYANESLITATKVTSGETGKEEITTDLLTLIPTHDMFVTIVVSGDSEKMSVVEEKYAKWFNIACQSK